MATVHFICGKAGAGKTTLARRGIAPLTIDMLRVGTSVVFDFGGNTRSRLGALHLRSGRRRSPPALSRGRG